MEKKERRYAAFISYRHLPLDMAIAEELQKQLERYRIPKELRREGSASLGFVFRDREELPLSSNLTEDIYHALNNSGFLIVICTPDTPKSQWVRREIEYFINKHGRDRVLTVHVSGSASESIPPQITHVYDEQGNVSQVIEPLSAFLADSCEKHSLSGAHRALLRFSASLRRCSYEALVRRAEYARPCSALKREFLRLVAAILGCPYDALIQRHKRYLYQRIMTFSLAAALVLLIFSGIVIGKNLQISGQNIQISQLLQQTQLQQSQALTALSRQQLANGDRTEAIRSALSAIPTAGEDRPWDPDAAGALAQALNLYADNGTLMTLSRMELTGSCAGMAISRDGRCTVTLDEYDILQCRDVLSGDTLWSIHHNENPLTPEEEVQESYLPAGLRQRSLLLEYSDDSQRIIHATTQSACVISARTGEHLFTLDYPHTQNVALSPDGRFLAVAKQNTLLFYDTADGSLLSQTTFPAFDGRMPESIRFLCYRHDGSALLCEAAYPQDAHRELLLLASATGQLLFRRDTDISFTEVSPTEDGGFFFFCPSTSAASVLTRLDSSANLLFRQEYELSLPGNTYAKPFWYAAGEKYFLCGRETGLYAFDMRTGDLLLNWEMDGKILSASWSDKRHITVFYYDGTVQRYRTNLQGDFPSLVLISELNVGYPVMSAVSSRGGEATYCLLPDQYNAGLSAQLLTVYQNNAVRYLPDTHSGSRSVTLSPDGTAFLLGAEDRIIRADSLQATPFPSVSEDYGEISGFTADSSKVIYSGGVTLDLNTGKTEEIELWRDLPALTEDYATMVTNAGEDIFYNELAEGWVRILSQKPGEPLLSAVYHENRVHWWLDDVHHESSPCPFADKMAYVEETTNVIVGENGLILIRIPAEEVLSLDHMTGSSETAAYVIYSTHDDTWYWLDYPFLPDAVIGYVPTAKDNWIACMNLQNTLYLVDPVSGTVVRQLSMPFSANAVECMHFLQDDRILMAILDTGYGYFIDTGSGEVLLGPVPIGSSYGKALQTDTQNNQLFVGASYNSTGIIVDLENWTVISETENLHCYLPSINSVLRYDNTANALAVYPAYTVEQMISLAKTVLSGT